MKQIFQNLSNGLSEIVTAPAPDVIAGHVLIDTTVSLISAGTERMLVDFGKANLLQKAAKQPDKVKQVLTKAKTDGILTTLDAVRSKLGQPIALGYCNVGVVREAMGAGGLAKGMRVASNGPHADIVRVPKNLCAEIPENVSDEEAGFTVVGAIGLQGIRLAKPSLGESFVVIGAGLIGLLTIQLLKAQGCRVLATDFDADKLALAARFGAETCDLGKGENPEDVAQVFSRGLGVDGVIITASTKSSDPVTQAARMCRQRGRIILVGVTGLTLNRADFYEKELSFQVSCSYGPGRYDQNYEAGGNDYPIGFVRWTEQRNFVAVLDMMASGQLDVLPLITHRFAFEKAPEAYDVLSNEGSALGVLLKYDHPVEARHIKTVKLNDKAAAPQKGVVLGAIGAGNYASRVLLPAFRETGASLHSLASSGGTSGVSAGQKTGFEYATSDVDALIANSDINTIAIATRHDSHAEFVIKALKAGKNVFVEKPLALDLDELALVRAAYDGSQHLVVGFNRRFAPHIITMKKLLSRIKQPKSFVMVMNAGEIPADHWTQDIKIGGGRIIGEACHYVDLMRFLAGSKIISVQARRLQIAGSICEDNAAIILGFSDGSFGTIHYLANGAANFPKERIEVFAAGATLQLDNFLTLRGFGWPGFKKQKLLRQDKGQKACVAEFVKAIETGGPPIIPAEEIFETAEITIQIAEALRAQL